MFSSGINVHSQPILLLREEEQAGSRAAERRLALSIPMPTRSTHRAACSENSYSGLTLVSASQQSSQQPLDLAIPLLPQIRENAIMHIHQLGTVGTENNLWFSYTQLYSRFALS